MVDTASDHVGIESDFGKPFRLDALASLAAGERKPPLPVALETQEEHISLVGSTLFRVFVARVTGQVFALHPSLPRFGDLPRRGASARLEGDQGADNNHILQSSMHNADLAFAIALSY